MILIFFSVIATLLQVLRISIYFLREDTFNIRLFLEFLLLIAMIIINYFGLVNKNYLSFSILLSIYILISFIYEILYKNKYISVLSVKKGIDMADFGIMFLDNSNNIVLINSLFYDVLKHFSINDNYINNLIKISFKKIDIDYLLRYNDKVYMLKIFSDKEVCLIDINELYILQEQEENQNKKIKRNNNKILHALKNIEELEKEKNLLRLKNEYHDIIGYRLALFSKYLESDNKDMKDALFLLDSIYEDFNSQLSSEEKLNNLVKMYHIIGVNVNIIGCLPSDDNTSLIFFEVIRESITNAIIHADSRNIKIVISAHDNYIEMCITNDGTKPDSVIFENEGIKGMRKKLASINGNLSIVTNDGFKLIIRV